MSWFEISAWKTYTQPNQESAKWANRDIQNVLKAWLHSSSTTHWGDGLPFVQVMKNRTNHEGIKFS